MPVNDLRDWIDRMDGIGQLRRVNGANCSACATAMYFRPYRDLEKGLRKP